MPTYSKQQLDAQYEKLPLSLKEALFSAGVAEKMFEIGKKNGLTIEKTGFMAEETGLIILGLLAPRDFAASLSKRLEISLDKAQAIASDINHQIFFPLREILKETHDIEIGEDTIHSEEVAPRQPPAATEMTDQKAPKESTLPPVATPPPPPVLTPPPPPSSPLPQSAMPTKPIAPADRILKQEPEIMESKGVEPMEQIKVSSSPIETKKPEPITLRKQHADDLQREVASLIGGVSAPMAPGPIPHGAPEKLAAQKPSTPQTPPANSPPQPPPASNESMIPPPPQAPRPASPTPPSPQITRASETPAQDTQTASQPIILEPLKSPPPIPPPAAPAPPLGTAKVPPIDLRNTQPGSITQEARIKQEPDDPVPPPAVPKRYEGFDPYKEPVE